MRNNPSRAGNLALRLDGYEVERQPAATGHRGPTSAVPRLGRASPLPINVLWLALVLPGP